MRTPKPDSHCSYCGHPYPDTSAPWPRKCEDCRIETWQNPKPVAAVLLPIKEGGIVAIRRDIEPARGQIALPAGYLETHESWQEGAVRELREETGIIADPADVRVYDVRSVAHNRQILTFCTVPAMSARDLPPFVANHEVSERLIVHGGACLAFASHAEMTERFLNERALERSGRK